MSWLADRVAELAVRGSTLVAVDGDLHDIRAQIGPDDRPVLSLDDLALLARADVSRETIVRETLKTVDQMIKGVLGNCRTLQEASIELGAGMGHLIDTLPGPSKPVVHGRTLWVLPEQVETYPELLIHHTKMLIEAARSESEGRTGGYIQVMVTAEWTEFAEED